MSEASFMVKTAGEVAKYHPSAKVLVPNGDDAYERLRSRPVGEVFRVVMKMHRNYKFLSKAMVMIKFAHSCQDIYPNTKEGIDHFRDAVTIEAGFYDEVLRLNGVTEKVAKSWNFDSMTEPEFQELFNAMVRAILQYSESVFNGVDPAIFERQILSFTESNNV